MVCRLIHLVRSCCDRPRQCQLLCIARALLRKPKLLFLDEATASIDSETDRKVQKALRAGFADATTVTVAHRIATIADSDRILASCGALSPVVHSLLRARPAMLVFPSRRRRCLHSSFSGFVVQ